jgi:hypothetical protein
MLHACGGSATTGTSSGGLRQACYDNGTCNAGLTCASNVCVQLGNDGGGTSSGGIGSDAGSASGGMDAGASGSGSSSGSGSGSGVIDSGTNADAADAGTVAIPDGSTLNTGLVSWWRGEGNANDSAGANNGTVQGGVTFVAGKVGQAFEFNGSTGDVRVPTSTTLDLAQGYTIAFWIQVAALPSTEIKIMIKWVSGAETKQVVLEPNGTMGLGLYPVASNGFVSTSTPLTLNTWHFVTATYDGSNERIYLDGQVEGSQAGTGNVVNSTGAVYFASDSSKGGPPFFAGGLDEIRWYSRALSASEVMALMLAD